MNESLITSGKILIKHIFMTNAHIDDYETKDYSYKTIFPFLIFNLIYNKLK